MDWTFLQTAALIVLGWTVLSVVATAGVALFLRGAHRLEHALPTEPDELRAWVRGEAFPRAAA